VPRLCRSAGHAGFCGERVLVRKDNAGGSAMGEDRSGDFVGSKIGRCGASRSAQRIGFGDSRFMRPGVENEVEFQKPRAFRRSPSGHHIGDSAKCRCDWRRTCAGVAVLAPPSGIGSRAAKRCSLCGDAHTAHRRTALPSSGKEIISVLLRRGVASSCSHESLASFRVETSAMGIDFRVSNSLMSSCQAFGFFLVA
jgi:hypothetical protein